MKIRFLLCALCVLCGLLPSQAAPLISIMATTNAVHVVKVPAYRIDWPTQTNTFHRATITNLTVNTITGVDAAEVAVADAAGHFATNTVESALLELANDVAAVDASAYLPKTGGTMSGAINMGVNNLTNVNYLAFDAVGGGAENSLYVNGTEDLVYLRGSGSASPGTASMLVMSSDGLVSPFDLKQVSATNRQVLAWDALVDERWEPATLSPLAWSPNASLISTGTLAAARIADGSLPLAKLADTVVTLSPAGGVVSSISSGLIYGTDGTQIYRLQNSGTVGLLGQAASGGTVSFYQTYPAMNGSAITSLTAGNLTGDVPAGGLGEVAITWTDKDFNKVEGTTNSVGWVGYDVDAGSRRFNIDALCSSITTDQSATLVSSIRRVPYGFSAFKSSGALRVTWVSNDTGGDNEIREVIVLGYSDLTSTETVIATDSTVRDVVSAGVPAVYTVNLSGTVPQWIGVRVKFSVEDGDKSGLVLVEVLSQ